MLCSSLSHMSTYYKANFLRPNPAKTQISAFHLRNREAKRKLEVTWENQPLAHCDHPVYLGVTLDRSLTYKDHILKTNSWNAIIKKLTHSNWGADPSTIRSTALALSYSAAEYASPVWERSSHAKKLDASLHDCCRAITGCLKPTKTDNLHTLAGIAPPNIRRAVASKAERLKQMNDSRHPLHGHIPVTSRLRSRRSFCSSVEPLEDSAVNTRIQLWESHIKTNDMTNLGVCIAETLPPGNDCEWTIWKSLNRLRTKMGRCKTNMVKWGYSTSPGTCGCGEEQTMSHLLICPNLPTAVTEHDLAVANDAALTCAKHWKNLC